MVNHLIRIDKVSKKYNKKYLFKDLSFDIKVGETIAVIGYSGCGKTTLLRMIGGFEVATSGSIFMEDKKVLTSSKEAIMVGQDHNQLFPWKTAIQNVSWPMIVTGECMSRKEAIGLAKKYLFDLGITLADCNKYPVQLSGGMKQRATIARALALKPKLLLLDEPFGSLDDLTRRKAQDVVKTVCERHKVTTVLVTHNIGEAIKMADRILVFTNNGKIELIKNDSNTEKRLKKLLDV